LTLMMTPKLGKRKSGVTELCSGDVTAGEEPEVLTTTAGYAIEVVWPDCRRVVMEGRFL